MLEFGLLLCSYIICALGQSVTPSTYLTSVDKDRLRNVFESSYNNNMEDLKTVHLSLFGYSILGETFPYEKEACALFKKASEESSLNIDSLYHLSVGSSLLGKGRCKVNKDSVIKIVEEQLESKNLNVEILYKGLMILKSLDLKVDSKKFKTLIDDALKKDSSAPVFAYVLHMVSELNLEKSHLKTYFDDIKDVILQADEADGMYAYYENGLFTTSFIVEGIFKLSEKYGEAPKIPEAMARKFANFLLSRRHTYQLRAAVYLTSALKTLGTNKVQVPVGVSVEGLSAVNSDNPHLMIRLSTVWGDALSDFKIVAESAKNTKSGGTFLTNTAFVASSGQKGYYTLDLMKAKPTTGFYLVKLVVTPPSKEASKYVGVDKLEVESKVTSAVTGKDILITIKEKDQGSTTDSVKLQWKDTHDEVIHLDYHHVMDLTFKIVSTIDVPVSVHQTFIKLSNLNTKQEIIFIAELDKQNVHKFSLDLYMKGSEFDYLTGDYSMELIIGDALIENPTVWHMANLHLVMPEATTSPKKDQTVAGAKKSTPTGRLARVGPGPTQAKPEIFHQFKQPDQRAGKSIAYLFSVLVIVPPVLIMFILWGRIGINVGNFPGSTSSLWSFGFHGSLLGIFGLYYCYWTHLNMFTTLFYLFILAIPTFICGWQVLAHLALLREGKAV